MADIAPSEAKITLEATRQRAPVSESLLQAIGGSINFLLAFVLPVGSKIDTMLTEAQFQAEVGNSDWVLMDGRNVAGTRYATLTGFTQLPDHRGTVTRMKNNGRSSASGNADGDVALGTYQGDQIVTHSHPITGNITGSNGTNDVEDGTDKKNSDPGLASLTIGNTGGNETRMRNTTMNMMIRIN